MGSGLLWQAFVSTTIRSDIHKCQLKLYCQKEALCNSVQKRRRLLWARRHLGWTITQWKRVLWSDESVFQVFFGRNGRRVLRTKEERIQQTVTSNKSKSQGLSWYGVVSVPLAKVTGTCCDGTINAEKYIEILEHNMLPSRRHIFSRDVHAYFNKTCKTTFCTHFKVLAAEEEGTGTWLACLQSRPVSNRECVAHFEAQNATTKTPYCCPP